MVKMEFVAVQHQLSLPLEWQKTNERRSVLRFLSNECWQLLRNWWECIWQERRDNSSPGASCQQMLSLLVIFPQHLKVVTLVLEWRACGQKTKCNATANVSSLFQAHFSQSLLLSRAYLAQISSCHFMLLLSSWWFSHLLLLKWALDGFLFRGISRVI